MKQLLIFRPKIFNFLVLVFITQCNIFAVSKYHSSLALANNLNPIFHKSEQKQIDANQTYKIGLDLFNKQDYKSALPILKKSLENYRFINDKKGESEALNTLGNIYQNLK
jgi:tetratricopeptide (TPR) repeat protein